MSARYAPIPNPQSDRALSEMEAAFGNDDDDVSDDEQDQVRKPLVPREASGNAYDFDRVDYDLPPPGSPPRPSSFALPANAAYGNTNGFVPTTPIEPPRRSPGYLPSWLARIIPQSRTRSGRIGGGSENDGVFANITSKPTPPRRYEDEDGVHIVPEETAAEAPPSYAAAQADAVPSYWETTVHTPVGGDVEGELIVDALPTGSLFSFLWSMLVSVAFNFLGFVLTYLLHTTHAAKYGSRAGLGITLIQYGWALRTREDIAVPYPDTDLLSGDAGTQGGSGLPDAQQSDSWRQQFNDTSIPENVSFSGAYVLSENATAWLSFTLMTLGWFLFLSSVLGFWRVKRWERGILHGNPSSERQQPLSDEAAEQEQETSIAFTFPSLFVREGLGLNTSRPSDEEEGSGERYIVQEIDRQRQLAEVRLNDARLHRNLRSAGLI